ncbi:thermonuclease family protein [Erythrobacter sp. WH158]|uniref:Thermonuclease family protein n=2 Tax=Erythrobacter crassostreae TaxID=2828328 RepID=A0A9X1F211_9SPHN|nr:thermonuclease family protein [Erythrobacter crassostrea]
MPAKRSVRWFPIALVALPLAAFSAVLFFPATDSSPAEAEAAIGFAQVIDREEAYFPICSGPQRVTCVVDGDTIWYRGEKIRLVGFDTPEVSNPGCANEARLGALATERLQDLLNEGAFSLEANPEGREHDRYGRALLVVSRGGANLGDMLVGEGLAERRGGRGNVWC